MNPPHIAIIMDGNGRWAQSRQLSRFAGHKAGVETARAIIRTCAEQKIEILTLFAFSSENWLRPVEEVNYLMDLFVRVLQKHVQELDERQIQLRFIGDRSRLNEKLVRLMQAAEKKTRDNTGMRLVVAINYGGRWDLTHAVRDLAQRVAQGTLAPEAISEETLEQALALADYPSPDLFIRTSGEQRLSNFCLWQLAYTELFFTDCYWPDFSPEKLQAAMQEYTRRQRRFGRTTEQRRFEKYV